MIEAPDPLDLVLHNVRAGRHAGEVVRATRTLVRDTGRPHVIGLLEASAYRDELRDSPLRHDYLIRFVRGWRESANIVALVRRDVPLRRIAPIRTRRPWIGPKMGRPHAGRTHLLVDVGRMEDPRAWRLILVHRVPGGPTGGTSSLVRGRNAAAWEAEHYKLADVADRPGSHRRAFVIVGDQNARPDDRHPLSPGGLADEIGARIHRTGAAVDWALLRDCQATSERLDSYGSDHPAIRYTLTHRER
jgi:hypothetical protein